MIYSGEYAGGKMLQFNPKTQTLRNFHARPGSQSYALGFDADGYLWYDSHNMDIIGRFDPRTGRWSSIRSRTRNSPCGNSSAIPKAGCGMARRRITSRLLLPGRQERRGRICQ